MDTLQVIAEAAPALIEGKIQFALAAIGGALGLGILGAKAAESTGRNPAAAGSILTLSIILGALIESIVIVTVFFAN